MRNLFDIGDCQILNASNLDQLFTANKGVPLRPGMFVLVTLASICKRLRFLPTGNAGVAGREGNGLEPQYVDI